jgi:hypothetical protein
MGRRAVIGAIAVLLAFGTASSASASPPQFVIRAGPGYRVQLGSWRVDRDPTYGAAIEAFGDASVCSLHSWFGLPVWRSLGFRMRVTTLGSLPAGTNYCTAPDHARVDSIVVTGRNWRTALGLRVGDRVEKLRQLYPHAVWHRVGWSLSTYRTICIGDCGTRRYVTATLLSAVVKDAIVRQFQLSIGAQGE